MGRWRPPSPESSPYITPAGFDVLQKELDDIWVRRRDVVKALAAAAAEGDRSENAEYIYRKKELGGLDRRIRYLQKRLPVLKVVRASPAGDARAARAASSKPAPHAPPPPNRPPQASQGPNQTEQAVKMEKYYYYG